MPETRPEKDQCKANHSGTQSLPLLFHRDSPMKREARLHMIANMGQFAVYCLMFETAPQQQCG